MFGYIFTYDIEPITKDNIKIINKNGKYFLPTKYKKYEEQIKWLTLQQIKQRYPDFKLFTKPVSISVEFTFKDNRRRDVLNYTKSFFDSLTGIIYKDDSQIYRAQIYKQITNGKSKIIFGIKEI